MAKIEYADGSRDAAVAAIGEESVVKLEAAGVGVVFSRHAAYIQNEQAKSRMDQEHYLNHILPFERARKHAAETANGEGQPAKDNLIVLPGKLPGPLGM